MSDLNPTQIFKNYRSRLIGKRTAISQLVSIIQNHENDTYRIESIEGLKAIYTPDEKLFEILFGYQLGCLSYSFTDRL